MTCTAIGSPVASPSTASSPSSKRTPEDARRVAQSLIEAGQYVLEVSTTTPGALEVVADLTAQFSEENIVIGVGTVLDVPTVRLAALAGARFVVSPATDLDVLRTAHSTRWRRSPAR